MSQEVICPFCERLAEFVDSARIYGGKSYGMVYDCRPCDAYVGVHKGTETPLGRLANKETRKWRNRAHAAFDRLWMRNQYGRAPMTRKEAYADLRRKLNLTAADAHIAMMNAEQCQLVVALYADFNAPLVRQQRMPAHEKMSNPVLRAKP